MRLSKYSNPAFLIIIMTPLIFILFWLSLILLNFVLFFIQKKSLVLIFGVAFYFSCSIFNSNMKIQNLHFHLVLQSIVRRDTFLGRKYKRTVDLGYHIKFSYLDWLHIQINLAVGVSFHHKQEVQIAFPMRRKSTYYLILYIVQFHHTLKST